MSQKPKDAPIKAAMAKASSYAGTPKDSLIQTTINNFTDFVTEAEKTDWLFDLVLFRGQAVQGNLLPNVARQNPSEDTTDLERKTLDQLKLLGASLLPPNETKSVDLLVMAQHFGLYTRLLDWTTNPMAALWFACNDSAKGDVFVYVLEADMLIEKNVYAKDPFATSKTRVIQPRHNNARIVAQDGWFTLHRYSQTAKSFVPLERNPDASNYLRELRIPAAKRKSFLKSLDRHGINSRTIYPDLAGLCKYLNWKILNN